MRKGLNNKDRKQYDLPCRVCSNIKRTSRGSSQIGSPNAAKAIVRLNCSSAVRILWKYGIHYLSDPNAEQMVELGQSWCDFIQQCPDMQAAF